MESSAWKIKFWGKVLLIALGACFAIYWISLKVFSFSDTWWLRLGIACIGLFILCHLNKKYETLKALIEIPQKPNSVCTTCGYPYKKNILSYLSDLIFLNAPPPTCIWCGGEVRELEYTSIIPTHSTAHLYQGIRCRLEGQYSKAVAEFTKAIEIDPAYAVAYMQRGLIYAKQGIHDKAIMDFKRAITINLDINLPYIEHWTSKVEVKSILYDQAITELSKIIEINSDSELLDLLYTERGTIYANKREYDKAIADFTKAIEINPRNSIAYMERGLIYAKQNQYEKADADFTKAMEIDLTIDLTYREEGRAYAKQREYNWAIAHFTHLIKINPDNDKAYVSRGLIHTIQGLYDKAIADFTKAIEINPNNDKAYMNRALVYAIQGLYDEATADSCKAIEINPRNSDLICAALEQIRIKRNSFDNRIKEFTKLMKLSKTSLFYAERGALYVIQGLYDEAIKDFTKAIRFNLKDYETYMNRGLLYAIQGLYEKAIIDFTKAIEIYPNCERGYKNRGLVYAIQGSYDKAIEDFTKATKIKLSSDDASFNIIQGLDYTKKGQYIDALISFIRFIRATVYGQPNNILAWEAIEKLFVFLREKIVK